MFQICKRVLLALCLLTWLGGCAFRHQAMIDPTIRQAQGLGDYLSTSKINSPSKLTGDTTLAKSRELRSKREKEDAYFHAEIALARYRLALAQEDLRLVNSRDSSNRAALKSELQELSAYEKILRDVKAKRGAK